MTKDEVTKLAESIFEELSRKGEIRINELVITFPSGACGDATRYFLSKLNKEVKASYVCGTWYHNDFGTHAWAEVTCSDLEEPLIVDLTCHQFGDRCPHKTFYVGTDRTWHDTFDK